MRQRRHDLARLLWLAAGHLALGLGIVGIAVPLLPTTPFLILASFCYSKGSTRFETWLLEHPHLGPTVKEWRQHRVIKPRAKAFALGTLALSVAYVLSRPAIPLGAKIAMLATILPVVAFILSRPARPPLPPP